MPSWRFDIAIEADLLEELARVIRLQPLAGDAYSGRSGYACQTRNPSAAGADTARPSCARGYARPLPTVLSIPNCRRLFDPELEPVALSNPISADMAVMRTSLLPGLVAAVLRNTNRQQPRVRLFETGLRFVPGQWITTGATLAMVVTGQRVEESWAVVPSEALTFYDLKGDLGEPAGPDRAPRMNSEFIRASKCRPCIRADGTRHYPKGIRSWDLSVHCTPRSAGRTGT